VWCGCRFLGWHGPFALCQSRISSRSPEVDSLLGLMSLLGLRPPRPRSVRDRHLLCLILIPDGLLFAENRSPAFILRKSYWHCRHPHQHPPSMPDGIWGFIQFRDQSLVASSKPPKVRVRRAPALQLVFRRPVWWRHRSRIQVLAKYFTAALKPRRIDVDIEVRRGAGVTRWIGPTLPARRRRCNVLPGPLSRPLAGRVDPSNGAPTPPPRDRDRPPPSARRPAGLGRKNIRQPACFVSMTCGLENVVIGRRTAGNYLLGAGGVLTR